MLWLFTTAEILYQQPMVKTIQIERTTESYQLYIPKTVSAAQPSPVLFIFDPSANGQFAIQHFIQAADTFGYIIAASNSSRNGLHSENFNIASRFINDVLEQQKVNPERMYVTGFSGGSRLASAIAVLSKQFAGVIGCGSGFSPNTSERPNFESFSYAAVVGDLDMNYAEMYKNKAWLNTFNVENALFVFDGTHQWPPSKVITRVFGWLESQAKLKGLPNSFGTQKQEIHNRETEYLLSLLDKNQSYAAYRQLQELAASLNYIVQVEQLLDLRKRADLKDQYEEESELLSEEIKEITRLNDLFFKHLESKKPSKHLKSWQKQIETLRGKTASPESLESKQAQRLLRHLQAVAFEAGIGYQPSQRDTEKVLFAAELLLLINPENSRFQQIYKQLKSQ